MVLALLLAASCGHQAGVMCVMGVLGQEPTTLTTAENGTSLAAPARNTMFLCEQVCTGAGPAGAAHAQ